MAYFRRDSPTCQTLLYFAPHSVCHVMPWSLLPPSQPKPTRPKRSRPSLQSQTHRQSMQNPKAANKKHNGCRMMNPGRCSSPCPKRNATPPSSRKSKLKPSMPRPARRPEISALQVHRNDLALDSPFDSQRNRCTTPRATTCARTCSSTTKMTARSSSTLPRPTSPRDSSYQLLRSQRRTL